MRIFVTIILFSIPALTGAQLAHDDFCNELTAFEGVTPSDYESLEEWANEFVDSVTASYPELVHLFADKPDGWFEESIATRIADCYVSGRGTEKNIERAMAVLDAPGRAPNSTAAHMLASLRVFRVDDPEVQRLGFQVLKKEAESGNAYSAGKLGWAYQRGLGVDKDLSKALELYNTAASQGMTYWQYLLAHAYEKGHLGLELDLERSRYWREFKPKVHIAVYECWVAMYYQDGTFPENERVAVAYQKICDESDISEAWEW